MTQNFLELYSHLSSHFPQQLPETILQLDAITPMGPHFLSFNGFYPPLKLLASEEQFPKWEKLVLEGRIIGAYAQTEIGHGSDVQSLQTVATYNKEKKCFVMNSPEIKATKFWVGVLGMHATHAILQAKTFIEGKNYGLQTFIVPIRDPKTYRLYPGIDCGDIGAKLGLGIMDNGYLRMKDYEIPRENLLMKFIKVEEDGKVTITGDKNAVKIGYGGMLGLRVWLSGHFLREGFKSLAIKFRALKKQEGEIGACEKRKLLKEFAYIYSGILTVDRTTKMHKILLGNIKTDLKAALEELDELHLIAAGFKPVFSWGVVRQTRNFTMQQALGNLLGAGTVVSYGDKVPGVTYEGDNLVLLQQVARGLCKFMQQAEKGKAEKIPPSFRFIGELYNKDKEELRDLEDLERIERVLERIGYEDVRGNYERMKEMMKKGGSENKVWNERLQTAMIKMGLRVSQVLTFQMAKKEILSEEVMRKLQGKDIEILKDMVRVYGLELLLQNNDIASLYGISFSGEMAQKAEENIMRRLEKELEYIGESIPFIEEELVYVRDYKDWKVKGEDLMEKSLKDFAEKMQKNISEMSKL